MYSFRGITLTSWKLVARYNYAIHDQNLQDTIKCLQDKIKFVNVALTVIILKLSTIISHSFSASTNLISKLLQLLQLIRFELNLQIKIATEARQNVVSDPLTLTLTICSNRFVMQQLPIANEKPRMQIADIMASLAMQVM